MSRRVYEMINQAGIRQLEIQLVLQCAPFLAGLKISNLLTIQRESLEALKNLLFREGIAFCILLITENRAVLLVYERKKLENYVFSGEAWPFMCRAGYRGMSMSEILDCFKTRYRAFMVNGSQFPHEMGILLGYPIEDVAGFVEHKGENCLYSGYWKVYGNVEAKKHLFRMFEQAQEKLLQRILAAGSSSIGEAYGEGICSILVTDR